MPTSGADTKNWQTVVDLLPVAVVFATEKSINSTIIREYFANETACKLLDLDREISLKNQLSALKFFPDAQLSNTANTELPIASPLMAGLTGEPINRRDLLVHGFPISIETNQYYGDSECIYAVTLQPRDHRLFVNTDIPMDMSSAELSIRDVIRFEKIVGELSASLRCCNSTNIDSNIQQALSALGEFCQADRTYVFLFDHDHMAITNTHEWVNSGISSHIDDLQNIPHQALPYFVNEMLQSGLFVVADTLSLPEQAALERDEFAREDIQSVLCIGLYQQQDLIGFIGIDMVARKRRWSEADIRRTRLIGELIATAITTERLQLTLQTSQQQLLANNDALRELVLRDGLTDLANQQQFTDRLQEELARARRQHHELTIVFFAINDYQAYNNSLGKSAGEALVVQVANLLIAYFRRNGELVSRLSEQRFGVLLPYLGYEETYQRCADFLKALAEQNISYSHSHTTRTITVSAGIAVSNTTEQALEELVVRAENALSNAKSRGGNHIESIS
ncbi:GGDEF domain-containing protein [Aliidiomarina sp.]|uniref:GGDEF domain-containing protein n=1 Tax=Aliidiomarina sp. TaxID=1872439 RepID=UPI003A4D1E4B